MHRRGALQASSMPVHSHYFEFYSAHVPREAHKMSSVSPRETHPETNGVTRGAGPTSLSIDVLRRRLDEQGSLATSDADGRRAAWLYLLDVPNQPIATWPAAQNNQQDDDQRTRQKEHSFESTPTLTSSSSSDLSQVTTDSLPSTSDLLSSSIQQNLPLDSEGWQTGFDSAILQQQEAPNGDAHESVAVVGNDEASSSRSHGADEWQTAQSKRARRRKGRSAVTGTDHSEGNSVVNGAGSSSSIFASVVDLENNKAHGRSFGTAQNGQAGTGFFSDLSVEGGHGRRNKTKKKGGGASSPNGREDGHSQGQQSASLSSAKTNEAVYKLPATYSEQLPAHRDERQVELDILRSFIGLASKTGPISTSAGRDARRRQLQDIVIGTLRRYPALNYYQGYHDVVSVLLLTLSPSDPPRETASEGVWASREDFDLVLLATSRLTLYYLRDFMAPKMDPCLGWLKCLRNTARATDEDFSRGTMEQASALPYFALSWIITCLAHELPIDSDEIRVVLDFILLRGPRGVLYILAALLVTQGRKVLNEQQEEDADDPAMLHHALSTLPATMRDKEGQTSALDQVLTEAKRLSSSSAADPAKDVMGSSSVLRTWKSIATSTDGTSAATWKKRDAKAASYISDPQQIAQIVLDPHPTPSPSDVGEDKKEQKRPAQGPKKAPRNQVTALIIRGIVIAGVAGVAVLIGSGALVTFTTGGSSTSFSHKSKLVVSDLTQLGKGMAGLAFCAAGVC